MFGSPGSCPYVLNSPGDSGIIDQTLGQRFLQVTWICQIGTGKDLLTLS